jgi:hypothetical protein
MKTDRDFAEFVGGPLAERFAPLEELRRKVARGIWTILGVMFSGALLSFALFLLMGFPICFAPVVIAIIASIILYISSVKKDFESYKFDYKFRVVGEIVKFVDPSLSYNPAGCIEQSRYMTSGIFTTVPDRYRSEDQISGTIGRTQIEFSEIHSEYKTETRDKHGHRHEQWHTIFKGVFIIADFNKDFKGRTVVLPDLAEKFFGFLGQTLQSWNMSRDQLVKLEDPDFEKQFVVYGSDQVEARYILSPALMRRMLDFNAKARKLCGGDVSFSFVGSKLFVAISCSKNLFEPAVFTAAGDMRTLSEYFSFVNMSAGIVEELDLNTRIWSKA